MRHLMVLLILATFTSPLPAQEDEERLVTRNASVSIRSFTPEATLEEVVTALEALGAYVQSSETGQVDMRIPASKLDTALKTLKTLGEVVDEQVRSEDVSLEVVQLRARIREVEKGRQRLLGMLELSENVKDSLLLEKELNTVTQNLESHQGRLRFLERRLAESPLTLHVSMKARPRVERLPAHRRPHSWVRNYGIGNLLQP